MKQFFVFAFLTMGMLVVTQQVSAAGITMSCSGPDCQACHIVQLAQTVINWLIGITASIIMLVFAIGGLKMAMAGGDTGSVTNAKHMMTNAVVGFILLLGSWLIINTLLLFFTDSSKIGAWNSVQCVPQPERTATPAAPVVTGTTPTGTTAAGKLSDADARAQLQAAGVSVNKTSAQGTSLEGINASTIQDAIDLHNSCNCEIVVTGGTEGGVHSGGTMSHGNGYKYDIRPNSSLDTYITTNYTSIGTRSDGAAQYRAPDGNVYAREGDHWDVQVRS